MRFTERIETLITEAFGKTTSPELIHKGSQHAYNHAGLQVQAAHALAATEAALQARISNLLRVAGMEELPGMDHAAATQLRVEAYLEAVGLLGLTEDNGQEETGNHGNDD